ncbi:MAG TPA: aldehyde dehydrogenase family protein [Mycobacteriales bacterium]|nr:aldehyde dehydrogenase family protein [Mycobacteriales bacterium]
MSELDTPTMLPAVDRRTGSIIGEVPVLDAASVTAAVEQARTAQAAWAGLSHRARRRHLLEFRRALVSSGDRLAETLAAETGKPLSDAWLEIAGGCAMITYAAHTAHRALRRRSISTWPIVVKRAYVEYSPYGVIGAITPWNYPVAISMQVIPFALAAGNAVVVKPSELVPLTGMLIGEIATAAGLDVVKVVTGAGATGEALVRSGVDKIAFTGSGTTARRILATAAESLTPVVMELGGKDAMIVCDDADVRQAARAAVGAAFNNAGQACIATERALVTASVYDAFLREVLETVATLEVGPGQTAHVGAVTRPEQIAVVERRLRDAVAAGARVVAGGSPLPSDGGCYYPPTVVVDVDPRSELAQEESFAPVLAVMRVPDADTAIRIANDSNYALNGSVFTRRRRRGRDLAGQLVAGGVNINDAMFGAAIPGLPFGGERRSGYGRLQGVEGLREFSRIKSVVEPRLAGLPPLTARVFAGRKLQPATWRRLVTMGYGARAGKRMRRSSEVTDRSGRR